MKDVIEAVKNTLPRHDSYLDKGTLGGVNVSWTDGRYFFKIPDIIGDPWVEHEASKLLREAGFEVPRTWVVPHPHMPSRHVFVSDFLHDSFELGRALPSFKRKVLGDQKDVDNFKLAIANWMLSAMDRHPGNYMIKEGVKHLVPIDYGVSFHPLSARPHDSLVLHRHGDSIITKMRLSDHFHSNDTGLSYGISFNKEGELHSRELYPILRMADGVGHVANRVIKDSPLDFDKHSEIRFYSDLLHKKKHALSEVIKSDRNYKYKELMATIDSHFE